jgi:hypothetical protein
MQSKKEPSSCVSFDLFSAMVTSTGNIELSTALLMIAIAAAFFALKRVLDLGARIDALEQRSPSPPREPQKQDSAPEIIRPEIAAVIAAAVHLALGPDHRIVEIAPVSVDQTPWSMEGRRQIFESHKVR